MNRAVSLIASLVLLLAGGGVHAQSLQWSVSPAGPTGSSVVLSPHTRRAAAVDAAGNVVLAGSQFTTDPPSGVSIPYVAKYDAADGHELWRFSSFGVTVRYSAVAVNAGGDVFVAGDDVVFRLDGGTGAVVWSAVVSPVFVQDIAMDPAGNVLITAGSPTSVTKLDGSNGALLWQYFGIQGDSAVSVAIDDSGDVFSVGVLGFGRFSKVVKLTGSSGLPIWSDLIPTSAQFFAPRVFTPDGAGGGAVIVDNGFSSIMDALSATGAITELNAHGRPADLTIAANGDIVSTGSDSASGSVVTERFRRGALSPFSSSPLAMAVTGHPQSSQSIAVDAAGRSYVAARTFSADSVAYDMQILGYDQGGQLFMAPRIASKTDAKPLLVMAAQGALYAVGIVTPLSSPDAIPRLTVFKFSTPPVAAATVTLDASPLPPGAGQAVTLTATVSGTAGEPTGKVTFRDLDRDIPACTLITVAAGVAACVTDGLPPGPYSITAEYSGDAAYATATSAAVAFRVQDAVPRASVVNLSTRGVVGTGDGVLIGGFVIGGTSNKTVAIVAQGPSLAVAGITNPLPNPRLTLVRSSDHAIIAVNDDWQNDPNAAQLAAAGFAPPHPLDSAILLNLPPGAYTAIVDDPAGATGVGIVAAYEVDHPEAPLVNISTRGRVSTGNDVMIAGFVIQGSNPATVVVTGLGPSLAAAGLGDALPRPSLVLVRSDGVVMATNTHWIDGPNAAEIEADGLAPPDMRESAIRMLLPPGAYTAILSDVNGASGTGLVAVYRP